MKRKKFYIILTILTIISLFSFAAICNQCALDAGDEEDVGEDEEDVAIDGNGDEDENGNEDGNGDDAEDENGNDGDENGNGDESGDGEKEAPTITLEIYEGPTIIDGVCYYRVEAIVTGNPEPTVEFNRDDSNGAWSTDNIERAQVNLGDPGETFTLTATAANSEGSANDSIVLEWGFGEENNDPVIDTLHTLIDEEQFYINSECSLQSHASDPDGDSLTYSWEVTGGTLDDPDSQNTIWTMPSTPGDYTITLTVSDGRGGEDTESSIEYITNLIYDFMEGAPGAHWHTGIGAFSFGGELNDSRGFARYRDNIRLEDGVTYSRVLETHPEWVDDGYIVGIFPNNTDKILIPDGARFTAKVGFIDGVTATDGAYFLIGFGNLSSGYWFPNSEGTHREYDGALNTLDFDLSSIAGKSGWLYLQVKAGATSTQDWAVWVDPKIIK